MIFRAISLDSVFLQFLLLLLLNMRPERPIGNKLWKIFDVSCDGLSIFPSRFSISENSRSFFETIAN